MLLRTLILTFTLLFSVQASAKSPPIVGTWELLKENNTHVDKLQGESKFMAMMMMEALPEVRFYGNGKFLTPRVPMQGNWKKEKKGYSWHTLNNVGERNTFKLNINKAGNLNINFDQNTRLVYSKIGAKKTIKREKDESLVAKVKNTIPFEKMFRTSKDFMGYFHFILISKDGKVYTMGTNKLDYISAAAFKKSAAIQELLVDKARTKHYTITPKGIYTDIEDSEMFKVISPQKVTFRDKVYLQQKARR